MPVIDPGPSPPKKRKMEVSTNTPELSRAEVLALACKELEAEKGAVWTVQQLFQNPEFGEKVYKQNFSKSSNDIDGDQALALSTAL